MDKKTTLLDIYNGEARAITVVTNYGEVIIPPHESRIVLVDEDAKFNKEGVPCGPVYAMDQVFADEQVKHLGIEMTLQHPRLGALNVVRAPMQIGGVACAKNPTPERGEHTDAVLAEFGFSADEIAALKAAKAV